MRNGWTMAVLVGLAVAAGTAGAQESQGQQQPGMQQPGMQGMQHGQMKPMTKQQRSVEATKHVAVIEAGLNQASENAEMLEKLASHPDAYDRDHGQVFLQNIQSGIKDAEGHLMHLAPLAQTDQERKDVRELGVKIRDANQMAQRLESQLGDAKAVQTDAANLRKGLDAGEKPLKQVAKSMNSMIDVG